MTSATCPGCHGKDFGRPQDAIFNGAALAVGNKCRGCQRVYTMTDLNKQLEMTWERIRSRDVVEMGSAAK